MSGSCSTHGRDKNAYKILVGEHGDGRVHLEDIAVFGKIILEWVLGK
jgi:hypothetical protein